MTLTSQRRATVLIMSVAVIVLMVTMATAFLRAVSPQRGAGQRQLIQRLADVAARSAQAHAIDAILDDYNNQSFTSLRGSWHQAFLPLAADNNAVESWEESGITGTARVAVLDDDINVLPENRLLWMLSRWGLDSVPVYAGKSSSFSKVLGAIDDNDSSLPAARWYNLSYLDKNMLSIIDQSADELEALNNAQYIMRYAVEILDADSHININPDYPNFPNISGEPGYDNMQPSFPVHYDASDPDNLNYLKYQSYLQRFGRAIRSMHSTRDARSNNLHPYVYGYEPFDTERSDIALDGTQRGNSKATYSIFSSRIMSEYFFRGDVSRWNTWANSHDNKQQTFIYAGPVHSPWIIAPVWDGSGTQAVDYSLPQTAQLLQPYGQGLRDQSWDPGRANSWHNGTSANNPNVPWNVNALTASVYVRSHMLLSLSADLMFQERGNGSRSSQMNLFGEQYPDPFPLSLDDGRHVDFIGLDGANGLSRIDFGFTMHGGTDTDGQILRASSNSYWWDAIAGLALSLQRAQEVFNRQWDPTNTTVASGSIYDPASLLDPSTTNPATIQLQIESEWLRIIGENLVDPSTGLLASLEHGNTVLVGYGDAADKKASRLEPGDNTRAMEYLLNDLRMSFFGSAPLNFNGDDVNQDGVVDQADAESTCSGWWHNGVHMWSWWWDGVQRTEVVGNEWMQKPCWYRFWYGESQMATPYMPGQRNRIARWTGTMWQEYIVGDPEFDALLAINTPFLNDPQGAPWSDINLPIKPWSASGRFFVGKSKLYRLISRGQVYDNIIGKASGEVNLETTFAIVEDPTTNNLEDSHVIYKRYHLNKNSDQ